MSFKYRNGRTELEDLRQSGSFKLRFPGTSGSEAAEVILINTAGGLTDGDSLSFDGTIGAGARVQFSTQGCERAYAARNGYSTVTSTLSIGPAGHASWLPQETILFNDASLHRRFHVDLSANSTALLHETVVFGRSARGETVRNGSFRDDWRVTRDGRLIHAEAFRISGAISDQLGRDAALAGNAAMATILLFAPETPDLLQSVLAMIADLESNEVTAAASAWDEKLIIRAVAKDSFTLRRVVVPLLKYLNGAQPLPRVWSL